MRKKGHTAYLLRAKSQSRLTLLNIYIAKCFVENASHDIKELQS